MQSKLGHLQINIHLENGCLYKEFFAFLGWRLIYDQNNVIGFSASNGVDFWFKKCTKDLPNDYDGVGTNHIAIAVEHQGDVDLVVKFLKQHGIGELFGTPCHRPERVDIPGHTMYHVMFESPDRILFEVVYRGPKDQ
jgi:catechol 2,3-dioxygenase-like lactoylglutathione lyase family enzyme